MNTTTNSNNLNFVISNIDRIIIRHQFCFQDTINKLINNSEIESITENIEDDIYLLSSAIQIYPITSCLNSMLLENVSEKFKFVIVNRYTKEIFCISNAIKEFLLFFKNPQKKEHLYYYFESINEDFYSLLNTMVDNNIILSTYDCNQRFFSVKNDTVFKLEGYKIEMLISENYFKKIFTIKDFKNKKYILKSLKLIENNYLQVLFNNEFVILNELQNSNYFCKVIYYNPIEFYGILEYAEGVDLDDYLNREYLSIIQKINIVKNLIDIIAFLHERDIIHGDIHLGQFKIDNERNIKILDLELANRINFDNNMVDKYFGGTFEYFEPENININPFYLLNGRITKTAEVYRVGIAIYYILFGEYPFLEITWQDLYKAKHKKKIIYNNKTKDKDSIPIYILNILKKCLSKNPQKRYKSCVEVKKILEKHLKKLE